MTSHGKWAADIEETQGHKVNYPMIGDPELKIAKLYDMLPADAGTTSEGRTAATNATVRTVFVVGPDKKIKLMLSYPMSTGRNFDEVLRVLDSIQLTAKHKVATPVNWKHGRGRDHRAGRIGRRSQEEVSGRLEDAEAVSADRAPTEVKGLGRSWKSADLKAGRPGQRCPISCVLCEEWGFFCTHVGRRASHPSPHGLWW